MIEALQTVRELAHWHGQTIRGVAAAYAEKTKEIASATGDMMQD